MVIALPPSTCKIHHVNFSNYTLAALPGQVAASVLGSRSPVDQTGSMTAPEPFRISFVCTGNICRSPMGEVIFRDLAERAGVGERFEVMSSGTHDYHIGKGADPRTVSTLHDHGYNGRNHRASQLSTDEVDNYDLLIAMDRDHEAILLSRGVAPERIRLMTEFDPEHPNDPDVFDPYYSDEQAFEIVLAQVERSCTVLLDELSAY